MQRGTARSPLSFSLTVAVPPFRIPPFSQVPSLSEHQPGVSSLSAQRTFSPQLFLSEISVPLTPCPCGSPTQIPAAASGVSCTRVGLIFPSAHGCFSRMPGTPRVPGWVTADPVQEHMSGFSLAYPRRDHHCSMRYCPPLTIFTFSFQLWFESL